MGNSESDPEKSETKNRRDKFLRTPLFVDSEDEVDSLITKNEIAVFIGDLGEGEDFTPAKGLGSLTCIKGKNIFDAIEELANKMKGQILVATGIEGISKDKIFFIVEIPR